MMNGRVKIDTSCSKPLEVGDVSGAYTVTDLVKIFDDEPDDDDDEAAPANGAAAAASPRRKLKKEKRL